jgi:hypothetical protein
MEAAISMVSRENEGRRKVKERREIERATKEQVSRPTVKKKRETRRATYGVKIACTERPAVLEYLVQAFLHRRKFVRLCAVSRQITVYATRRTTGMSSSETGSLEDSSR